VDIAVSSELLYFPPRFPFTSFVKAGYIHIGANKQQFISPNAFSGCVVYPQLFSIIKHKKLING